MGFWIGCKSYLHPTHLTATVWLRPASSSSVGVKVHWLRPAGGFQLLTARCGDTHPESDGADGRGAADSSWVGLVFAGSAREQQWLIPCEASCESHFHSGESLFFFFSFFSLRLSPLQGFRLLSAFSCLLPFPSFFFFAFPALVAAYCLAAAPSNQPLVLNSFLISPPIYRPAVEINNPPRPDLGHLI